MILFNDNKPPEINITLEQDLILNSTESYVLVNAAPGSGKSTLLRQIAYNNPGKRILYLAYNKAIVEDIRRKLPSNCETSTFHAFGLKIIRSNGNTSKVNFRKYLNLSGRPYVANLVQKHMITCGGPNTWVDTCNIFNVPHDIIPRAKSIYNLALLDKTISAEDMLSLPIREEYDFPEYDIVLVDEYQDMSMDKILLCSQIKSERIFFVGDVNQKINQYAGSSSTIEEDLALAYKGLKTYNINESFRCPEEIIKEMQYYVNDISSSKTGGSVSYTKPATFPDNSLIICRSNAPLLRIATKFIRNDVRFRIRPQVISNIEHIINGLSSLTSNLSIIKAACIQVQQCEIERYRNNKWNSLIPEYKYDAVMEVLLSGSNLPEVQSTLNILKSRCNLSTGHMLSTAHSSKGLENENVFIVDIDICKNIARNSSQKWAKQAESNVAYVMISRSLNNLTYLEDQ